HKRIGKTSSREGGFMYLCIVYIFNKTFFFLSAEKAVTLHQPALLFLLGQRDLSGLLTYPWGENI
ncbi:MAG: hypothetical protein PVG15_12145, partial [Desulfobacterales bacterium]